MGTKDIYTVGYHFLPSRHWMSRVVQAVGRSSLSHVYLSLTSSTGTLYYNCSWTERTLWYTGPVTVVPKVSLYETLELDIDMVDMVLPIDEHYSLPRVVSNYLVTYPRHPLSCVEAVKRIRHIGGKETKGRTTGGLYRYLKERLPDQRRLA